MALDQLTQELCKETVETIKLRAQDIRQPVAVSARRMRALILATQERMTITVDGVPVVLFVADNAPELSDAINAACEGGVDVQGLDA